MPVFEPLQRAYNEHGEALFIPWDGHNSGIANNVIALAISGSVLANMRDEPQSVDIAAGETVE